MTDRRMVAMRQQGQDQGNYECVQPELGDQIWRLEQGDLSTDLRDKLQDHLAVCDSCRLVVAVGKLAHEAAPQASRDWLRPAVLSWAGSIALAASLFLALMLPPGQLEGSLVRGDNEPAFVRPVEGEILWPDAPRLSWLPVPGATSYQVQVTGMGNDFQWSTETTTPEVTLPSDHVLTRGQQVRAVVQTIPADLLPMGAISVTFRREGLAQFVPYRIGAAPTAARTLGWLGTLVLLSALAMSLGRRRTFSQ